MCETLSSPQAVPEEPGMPAEAMRSPLVSLGQPQGPLHLPSQCQRFLQAAASPPQDLHWGPSTTEEEHKPT